MTKNKDLYFSYTSALEKQKLETNLMWKKLNFVANRDRKKGFDNEFKINKRAIKGSPLPPNCYEDINDTDIDKIGKF